MDNDRPHFLPSEVARLVLGYLENEGYTATYKSFMRECIYLQEYIALLKRGRQYPLKINGLSLIEMLDKYAQIYIIEKNKQSTGISALWSQLESVTACLKKQTSSKNLRVEGCSQNSRTRRAIIMSKYEQDDKGGKRLQSSAPNIQTTAENVKSPEHERLNNIDPAHVLIIPDKLDVIPNKHPGRVIVSPKSSPGLFTEGPQTIHSSSVHKSPTVKLKSNSFKSQSPSHVQNDEYSKRFESAHKISRKDEISASKDQLCCNRIILTDPEDSSSNNKLVIKTPEKKSGQYTDFSDGYDMDTGAGFHDASVNCDTNTQLSPLPTLLRTDDVKDRSGEGNGLSGICDKANLESLTNGTNTSRENLGVCIETSRENLTALNDLTEVNLSGLPKDNDTNVEHMQVCDETNKKFSEKDKTDKDVEMEVDSIQQVHNEKEVTRPSAAKIHNTLETSLSIPCQQPPSSTSKLIVRDTSNLKTCNTQTTTDLPGGQREDRSQTIDSVVPITPKKHSSESDLPMAKTPGKNIRDYGFHGQGKSPRRKRPPKRKSHGDSIKDRRSSTHMNESSNSNDGSVHDNSFHTQFLEQLLNNPLLHEKLAENINKTINCSDLSKSQNLSDTSLIQDTSKAEATTHKTSISLEDILDPHESQMTEGQINHIIDMTKGDNVFESLFELFNQDDVNGIDEEGILRDNNNIDNIISGANVIPTVNPNTQVTTSTYLTLNLEPSTGFKPINSADVMNSDSLLSFPTISKDVSDKSFKNLYVSENSIDAVLNPFPTTRTRTLNTPTDFSMIHVSTDKFNSEHHSNVNTSVSSSIAPTVTISTSSKFVMSDQSPCTTASQSCSQIILSQSSSVQLTQGPPLPGKMTYSESTKCLSSTVVSQLPLSDNLSSSQQPQDFRTPSDTPLATVGSSQGSKTSSYVSFVKGATDNSSTPVGERASPLTVQFEDTPNTFQELPSEVKNLYSSFEKSLEDLSSNQETAKDEQSVRKTRSSEKNINISPKLSACKQKLSSTTKKTSEKPKTKNSPKITSSTKVDKSMKGKKMSVSRSKVTGSEADTQNQDISSLTGKSDSTKSEKKSQPGGSKSTDSRKTSPVSTKKDNKSVKDAENIASKTKGKGSKQQEKKLTPKPQIRCNPLQPRNDRGLKSTPKSSHTKWSSGLTALIKIASPEKSKQNATQNVPKPVLTSGGRMSKEPVTDTSTLNENEVNNNSGSSPPTNKASNTGNTTSSKNPPEKQGITIYSPKPSSLKSKPQKEPETFLCGISPTSKNIIHIPVKERKMESSQNVFLDPSCIVVKDNSQTMISSSETAQPNTGTFFLSMPLLDGSSPFIPIAQPGISVSVTQNPAQMCNNANNAGITPESTKCPPLLPFVSNIPSSNLNDTYYSESVDFLDSPSKHRFKTVTDIPRSCHNNVQNEQNTPVQAIYTATPLTELIGSQQIHIRTLDIETVSNSSHSPEQSKPKRQSKRNQIPLVKVSTAKRGKKEGEKKPLPKISIKKTVLEVLNNDTSKNLDCGSIATCMTGTNINIGHSFTKPKLTSKPEDITKSLGLSSVMDGNVSIVIDGKDSGKTVMKDASIYRPLSETESEDGNNSVTYTHGQLQNVESSNDSDFIPDAAGNVHMQNGQIMTLRSPNSKSSVIVQSSNSATESSQQKSLQLIGLSKKDSFDLNAEKFIVSPSCQKLIGQLGFPPQYEKHLGQPLNINLTRSRSSNTGNRASVVRQVLSDAPEQKSCEGVSSTGSVLSMPMVYDIHLDREKSNDTYSSEPKQTVNSPQCNMEQRGGSQAENARKDNYFFKPKNTSSDNFSPKVNEKGDSMCLGLKNKLFEDNRTRSPFSTDSEDIDVEGDWENPWANQFSSLSNESNNVTLTENRARTTEKQSDNFTSPISTKQFSYLTTTSPLVTGQTETISTSQNSQLTCKLIMTPPKKRVTASMKCGGGLYFVSTKGNDNGSKMETSTKTKKTPKKSQDILTDLRRSPRIKAATQKSGKQTQQVEKVKKNLTDFGEKQKAKCDLLKAGNKRLREESDDDSLDKDSRPRTKKCKTPVDLTKLNVDKFLSKLYKA